MAKPPMRTRPSTSKPKQQPFQFPSPIPMGFINFLWHGQKWQIRLYSLQGNGYEIRIEHEVIVGPPPRQFNTLSKEQIDLLTPNKPAIIDDLDISVLPQEIREDLDKL